MSRLLSQAEVDALRAREPYVPAPRERYRIVVEAGAAELTPEEVAGLRPGMVLALDRGVGQHVPIVANGIVVAHGEIVAAGDRVAIRVTSIERPDAPARPGATR